MDASVAIVVALLAGLAAWWWMRSRSAAVEDDTGGRSQRVEALDTVTGWPPEATRVLTLQERKAYTMLVHALPDHMVLAQVPIARFVRVPTRNSYHEWMRRVGQLCADLVVCDAGSQVIAVVELRRPPGKDADRTRKRHDRMDRVLRKAGVRVLVWNEEALPHPDAVREQVLPTPAPMSVREGGAKIGTRPAPATAALAYPTPAATATAAQAAAAAARPMATLDDVLAELDQAETDRGPLPDPTPSTWFDNLDSGSTPLDEPKKR
jgi:hypothetical protein